MYSFFTWLQTIYAKIMQAAGNSKAEKPRFAVLDTAEPPLILYKDKAYIWQCKEIIRQSCKEIS